MNPGIVIIITICLMLIGLYIFKTILWNGSRPQFSSNGIGIRYLRGCTAWTDLDCVTGKIRDEISNSYSSRIIWMNDIILEIVPFYGARITPTTVVSEANKIAGSIDIERKFPWSKKYYVAVVLQRKEYDTADKSAVAHEIVKHIFPLKMWDDLNNNHSIELLNTIVDTKIENACH